MSQKDGLMMENTKALQDELRQHLGEELFAAVIEKGFLKTRQGQKGKGKGKARTCWKCGSEDHMLLDCPKATDEEKSAVKAKGEAAKAKGKGDKGVRPGKGYQWPSPTQWGQMYPGPSKQMWQSWYGQVKGKGSGKDTSASVSTQDPLAGLIPMSYFGEKKSESEDEEEDSKDEADDEAIVPLDLEDLQGDHGAVEEQECVRCPEGGR